MNSLATRGNKMELLSNDDLVSKEMETGVSKNDHLLAEAELCETHGYELAMSPAETIMPDDDQSWISISEDSTESQTTGLKMATEIGDFDLLEPFLIDSGRTYKRTGKVSELYWFSEDSSDSQTSIDKTRAEEFDQLETTLFSTEPPIPLIDLTEIPDNQPDEGKSNDSANSKTGKQASEKYIAETTMLVKSLTRRMTLGQKSKFYGWFSSGLSIEEAALNSKIPDLIPPPVRHPDCKLSKKRLQRLSKILPNVFLQRQFVNEVYFVGVNPKQIMRYLLMDLGSENLMATFECQFALEEYAAAKDKQLRQDERERAVAANALTAAPAPVEQLINPDFETGTKELNSEINRRRTNGLKLKNQANGEKLPRVNVYDRTAAADASPIFELIFGAKKKQLRGHEHEGTAATADALAHSDLQVSTGEPNSQTNGRKTNGFWLKGNELKKFYFGRKQELSVHEAATRAKLDGRDRDIIPHPDCKHSWERLRVLAKALPSRNSREVFLVKAYYEGKDPGEVLQDILSGENDSLESSQVAGNHALADNVTDGTSFVAEEVLVTKPCTPSDGVIFRKAVETLADVELSTEKSAAEPQRFNKSKPTSSRAKRNSKDETKHDAEMIGNKKRSPDGFKSTDLKCEVNLVLEPESSGGHSEIPRMSLKQLKNYYKWRNQGSSHSEALVKAQTTGLIPQSVSHPDCKHSLEEVKDMSDAISKKHKRLMFQIEVFYGGKKPEDVMRTILSSYQEDSPSKPNTTADSFNREMSDQSISRPEFSQAEVDSQLEQSPSGLEAKSVHTSSVDRPVDEDTTELSRLGCKQLKNYYSWRNSGLSFSEALSKARLPRLTPKTEGPHPDCRDSLEEIRAMASTLSTRSSRYRFYVEVYYGGKDSNEMLEQMKTELPQASKPNVQNGARFMMPSFLRNGRMGIGKTASGEMLDAQPGLENTISEDHPSKSNPPADSFGTEMSERSISHPEFSHPEFSHAEVDRQLEQGPSMPEQAKSIHTSSIIDRPVDENTKELSMLGCKQLEMYYRWRNSGLSFSEALSKARMPGLTPKTKGRHPNCKDSDEEIKAMASTLPTRPSRDRFYVEVYYGGKDPNEMLKQMKTGLPQASNPNVQNGASFTMPEFLQSGLGIRDEDSGEISNMLKSVHSGSEMPSFVQNGMVNENPASREMGSVRPTFKNSISEGHDDSVIFRDSVQELSNRPLKKYYAWRNKGLPHDAAFSKALCKHHKLSDKELDKFYVRHSKCRYSMDELKQMSLKLPEGWARERFFIHTFFGGIDPALAMSLLKRTPLPNGGLALSKSQQKLMTTVQTRYLKGKGLSRRDALKMMRNPSEDLMKELKDVIQLYCIKEKADKNRPNLAEGAASTKIPLSSPYHPSMLLSDDQLMKYYLWISKGCSRADAIAKVMNREPIPQDVHELHRLNSKYNLEEVKKMSKKLMNEALAKAFIVEVFYGQTDPVEVMEFMSPLAKSLKPHQVVGRDISENPWLPSKKAQDIVLDPLHSAEVPPENTWLPSQKAQDVVLDPLHSAEVPPENPWLPSQKTQDVVHDPLHSAEKPPAAAPVFVNDLSFPAPASEHQLYCLGQSCGSPGVPDTPTMAYSGYAKPADLCSTIEQQYVNNTVDISDFPNQTPSSSKGPLDVQNSELENNQVQCFIVSADFPNEILTEPQMDAIENSVLEAILEMDDDDTKPSFKDAFRSNGRYGIICNDEFSVGWLYKYLRVYEPWEGALLRMITNQSTKMRANAVLPLCKGDDDEKILKFIEKQNFGLNVDKWTVCQRWDSSDGTFMDLVIDEESAEVLLQSSRISFKLGTAEIITCQKDSSNHVSDSASPPPLPSSPPPASPPPPPPSPPPSPQPPSKPCTIDTSLGALLRSSALKSTNQDHSQVHSNSAQKHRNIEVRGERRSRRDQSLRERKRSRSSSLDRFGRIPRDSSPRARKRRWSEKERKRSAPRSTSRDHEKKLRKCNRKDRHGSGSPSPERSGSKGGKHSWLDWFYQGGEKRSPERFLKNPKRAPLPDQPHFSRHPKRSPPDEPHFSRHPKRSSRSTSPCSFISSEDNLSLLDDPRRSSLPSCPPRADSLENTEYAQYLGNSIPKRFSNIFVDLTDST